jgi:hypothetical protein
MSDTNPWKKVAYQLFMALHDGTANQVVDALNAYSELRDAENTPATAPRWPYGLDTLTEEQLNRIIHVPVMLDGWNEAAAALQLCSCVILANGIPSSLLVSDTHKMVRRGGTAGLTPAVAIQPGMTLRDALTLLFEEPI